MKERNNKVMKLLDRYIGCPLLFFLGKLRVKASYPTINESPRIMVLKTAAIGDTILMDAVIKEIKSQYPRSEITFVCSKSNLAMVKMLKGIDRVFLFRMNNPLSSLQQVRSLGMFDFVLDFAPWARINGLISWIVLAKFKVGFRRRNMYRHYIYDVAVEHRDDLHEIDNYRNILKAARISVHGFIPQLIVNAEMPKIFSKYVVFHMFPGGSSVHLRSWSSNNWIELGRRIGSKYGCKIVFTGGIEDAENATAIAKKVQGEGTDAVSIAAKYPLKDIPTILANADLVISVNTGIMHMSAAVNVPLIALHGATSDKRWGPLSDRAVVIKSGEPCQPCISLGFESKCQRPVCMEHITVDRVWEKVESFLG